MQDDALQALSSFGLTITFSKTTYGIDSSAVPIPESFTSLDSSQKCTNYAVAFKDCLFDGHAIGKISLVLFVCRARAISST